MRRTSLTPAVNVTRAPMELVRAPRRLLASRDRRIAEAGEQVRRKLDLARSLNRFLASAGLGSRRSVEELITTGQVKINGRVVTDLATQVIPTDAVKVGSRLVQRGHEVVVYCRGEDRSESYLGMQRVRLPGHRGAWAAPGRSCAGH